MITLKSQQLDNRTIAYSSETDFLVQVGKGAKGSYKTRCTIKGNLGQAVFWYNCINIGYGYKKRLMMPSCSRKPVLARQSS